MRGWLLVLVAALVLLATGCRLDVDVHVQMASDGSGTITVTAVADAELVAQAPGLAADLRLDDLQAAGWTVEGPAATPEGGLRVVLTHGFAAPADATALLATLNGTGGPFHDVAIIRDVDGRSVDYAAAGNLHLSGGIEAFADEQVRALGAGTPFATTLSERGVALADAVGITLQVQLPTEADSTNGTRDGNTVSWEVPLDGSATRVEAAGRTSPSNGAKRLLALLALGVFVGWVALATAFLVYVARHRRRPARRA